MKFIDIFCGIGGFRVGMEKAGHTCVWSCEINKYPRMIYKKQFGTAPEGIDIRKVNAKDIPDHDVICAGVSCQSWSMAGKRKGFEDSRGTLWYEIFRITDVKKPKYLFIENVVGLLTHDGRKSFITICKAISNLGYAVDFDVLNSKYFGVAQNRPRVFLLCRRLDTLEKKDVI